MSDISYYHNRSIQISPLQTKCQMSTWPHPLVYTDASMGSLSQTLTGCEYPRPPKCVRSYLLLKIKKK